MTETLIGLFNSFHDALKAADRLTQEAIARSDIDIHAQDDATEGKTARSGSPNQAQREPLPQTVRPARRGTTLQRASPTFSNVCSAMTMRQKK